MGVRLLISSFDSSERTLSAFGLAGGRPDPPKRSVWRVWMKEESPHHSWLTTTIISFMTESGKPSTGTKTLDRQQ